MASFKKFLFALFLLVVIVYGGSFWLSEHYVVPIIMYHKIEAARVPSADTVTPASFMAQMKFLKNNGYDVISLDDLVDGIQANKHFSFKTVVLTFDDGYENNFTHAFPVLKKYGFPSTIFIPPDMIGHKRGFLNWDQVRAMHRQGMDVGSHGMTQAYLPDLSQAQQKFELEESKRILEGILGEDVEYFAYPVGGFNEDIKKMLTQAGYKAALTTNRGADRDNKDIYELNRIRLNNDETADLILWIKMSGYYNLFRKLKKPY